MTMASGNDAERPRRIPGNRDWILLLAANFFARLSYELVRSPALPLFVVSLGGSAAWVGLIGSVAGWVGLLARLPGGVLADVAGTRRMMLWGGALFAAGPAAYPWLGSLPAVLAVRVGHAHGWPAPWLGGLVGGHFGALALASPWAGRLADRRGWRAASRLGLACGAAGLVASAAGVPWALAAWGAALAGMAAALPRIAAPSRGRALATASRDA